MIKEAKSEIRIDDTQSIANRCRSVCKKTDFGDFVSFRFYEEIVTHICIEKDVLQPIDSVSDVGVMVMVIRDTGIGYSATPDVSEPSILHAVEKASEWARLSRGKNVFSGLSNISGSELVTKLFGSAEKASFETRIADQTKHVPWDSEHISQTIDRLSDLSRSTKIHPEIVFWSASLWRTQRTKFFFAMTRQGASKEVFQKTQHLAPDIRVLAARGSDTQTRTFNRSYAYGRQAGLELLDELGFYDAGPRIANEARELLCAPNCPSGNMDLLLSPDQLILQLHESIGHPLELDRILGDERNYAGTSFVTLDMFGTYQYGSKLLNVTFDPTISQESATYIFDDNGQKATKEYLIKDGILVRPLGGALSQLRAGQRFVGLGTANARACSWNRPPIDRMANLNIEPGSSKLEEMISSVDRGIYMKTNSSWSIDDSRNKFQFGCEWARLIEKGRLTTLVRKPNYRGISAIFWRNLKMLGDSASFDIMGTPNCGKGEPNQVMYVGHAVPAALFSDVAVFGGEK